MSNRKLVRDKVISIVEGKGLVGIYFEDADGSSVLMECNPERADRIVGVWNSVVDEEVGDNE